MSPRTKWMGRRHGGPRCHKSSQSLMDEACNGFEDSFMRRRTHVKNEAINKVKVYAPVDGYVQAKDSDDVDVHSGDDWDCSLKTSKILINDPKGTEALLVSSVRAMSRFTKRNQPEQALRIFNSIQDARLPLNTYVYTAAINAANKSGRWEYALQLFHQASRCIGLDEISKVMYGAYLSSLERGSKWTEAISVFTQLEEKNKANSYHLSTSMQACLKAGFPCVALKLFEKTKSKLFQTQRRSSLATTSPLPYLSAIKACRLLGYPLRAISLLEEGISFLGLRTGPKIQDLVRFTSEQQRMGRNLYNAAIYALSARCSYTQHIDEDVDKINVGNQNYNIHINNVISGRRKVGEVAADLIDEMVNKALNPDEGTFIAAINVCNGDRVLGGQIALELLERAKAWPTSSNRNGSISATLYEAVLGCCVDLSDAEVLISEIIAHKSSGIGDIQVNDRHRLNLIEACAREGRWDAALDYINSQKFGFDKKTWMENPYIYTSVITMLRNEDQRERAMELLAASSKQLLSKTEEMYNADMEVYCKFGMCDEAHQLLSSMRTKRLKPTKEQYGSLFVCYNIMREWQSSLSLIKSLGPKFGFQNPFFLTHAIAACGKAGKPRKALWLLRTANETLKAFAKDAEQNETIAEKMRLIRRGHLTTHVFNAAVEALAFNGFWISAWDVLRRAQYDHGNSLRTEEGNGLERGVISILSTFRQTRRWELALKMLGDVDRSLPSLSLAASTSKTNTFETRMYNLVMNTLSNSGYWLRALRLYQLMKARSVRVDDESFKILIPIVAVVNGTQSALFLMEKCLQQSPSTYLASKLSLTRAFLSGLKTCHQLHSCQSFSHETCIRESENGHQEEWILSLKVVEKIISLIDDAGRNSQAQHDSFTEVFEERSERVVVKARGCVQTAMALLAKAHRWERAIQLLSKAVRSMRQYHERQRYDEDNQADEGEFFHRIIGINLINMAALCYGGLGRWERSLQITNAMALKRVSLSPNSHTFAIAAGAALQSSRWKEALKLIKEFRHHHPKLQMTSALASIELKARILGDDDVKATKAFEVYFAPESGMFKASASVLAKMILLLSRRYQDRKALDLWNQMEDYGMMVTGEVTAAALSSAKRLGEWETAETLYSKWMRSEAPPSRSEYYRDWSGPRGREVG
mmetsp:Transcript_3649/g.8650  ORF Transcript_3649/g.8650 Transcript_3649/m.8650 type:complete len:1154 (-) Transcript_3649:71-3532(-)